MSKKIIAFIDLTTSSLDISDDTDESFISEVENSNSSTKKHKSIQSIAKTKRASRYSTEASLSNDQATINNYGECPICMDKLGENPLAATKCGHVFCMQCLQSSLLVNKICPTCRCSLTRKSQYHPLYLNNN